MRRIILKVFGCELVRVDMQDAFGALSLLIILGSAPLSFAWQSSGEPPVAPVSAVQTRDLYPDGAIHFSTPAPVTVASKIKCGPGGDIYAVYSSNPRVEVWGSPIRRISLSSRSITEYPIPSISGYQKLSRTSFDVDTNGILYALLQARPQSRSNPDVKYVYLIVRYKEDGSVDSYYPLAELPDKKIQPTSFTMLADGNSLVSGTIRDKSSQGNEPGVFSAIFNETGRYRTSVTLVKPTEAIESGSMGLKGLRLVTEHRDSVLLASSLLTLGSPDGNIYVLQDEHLNVVSHGGFIEREIPIPAPNKDVIPVQMAAAGVGYLFAFYGHISTGAPGDNAQPGSTIRVVNLQTGEIVVTYRMPQVDTDFAVAACAVSINDFVFLSSDPQNNLEVVHYRPK